MKTVYLSEKLGKTFETEEECLKAEEENEKKLELEKAKKEERKARAEEVDKAFKEVNEAYKVAKEKLSEFCKDYGAYHKTYKDEDGSLAKSFCDLIFSDGFFNLF